MTEATVYRLPTSAGEAGAAARASGDRTLPRPRLIAVDDDDSILDAIGAVARRRGYEVLLISDPAELAQAQARFSATVIISDLMMPNVDGVTVLRNLALAGSRARVILASAADARTVAAAVRVGRNYGLEMAAPIAKPFDVHALEAALDGSARDVTMTEMREALAGGQFEVRYQPKVSLHPEEGERMMGAEALIRWNHPERGLLSADRFIGLAEAGGLIQPLSAWALSRVIRDLAGWRGQLDDFAVAVNLPGIFFESISFPDHVAGMLNDGGVSPANIMFEVTEREGIVDQTTAIDVMTRLRLLGVGLSMDDFGIGHSSLAELYRMPFSEVKIDQSFVRDLAAFPEARKIIRSVVELARDLDIDCCAEGVETRAQARDLRKLGCRKGQGYLFGGALPASHLGGLLLARDSVANDLI